MAANAKAAAAAAGPRKKSVTPARVARCFVKQYYGLLRTKPNDLFRFYKTDSHFTHGSGTEPVDVVVGKAAIAHKIAELDFSSVVVDLENGGSVDYHASQDGGVLVVVLGHMSIAGSAMRPFTQTFFLAPQASGFYVRNDAFRFFSTQLLGSAGGDDMELTPETSAVAASPEIDARAGEEAAAAAAAEAQAAADAAAAAAAEERAAAKAAAEEAAALEAAKQEAARAAAAEKAKAAAAKAPAAPQAAAAAAAAPNVPAGNNNGNGRPKRENGRRAAPAKKADAGKPAPKPAARPSSYLAAVRSKAAAAAAPKPQKRRAPQGAAATASAASAAAGASAPGARRAGGNNGGNSGGNSGSSQPRSSAKGIFCRVQNSVTEAQVREVFGKFGTIASLQITTRGFFKLEYTEASAAAACLKASPITLNGAAVQPDKLQNTRSRGGRGGDGRRGGSSGSGGGRNGGGRGSRGSRRDTRNRGRRAPPTSDRRNGGGNSGGGGGGGDRRRRAAPAGAQ